MYKKIFLLIVLGVILSHSTAMADGSDNEKTAVVSAEKWVALLDEGKYIESWKDSSEYFKQAVKQDQWEKAVQAVRQPLVKGNDPVYSSNFLI